MSQNLVDAGGRDEKRRHVSLAPDRAPCSEGRCPVAHFLFTPELLELVDELGLPMTRGVLLYRRYYSLVGVLQILLPTREDRNNDKRKNWEEEQYIGA